MRGCLLLRWGSRGGDSAGGKSERPAIIVLTLGKSVKDRNSGEEERQGKEERRKGGREREIL